MANRLAGALSSYLTSHAANPVDWWPWSTEAFAEARRRDVPVFLSVGYSACHWCHVMAHESFEDPDTAALLNAHFVSIKVDREERPDVDAAYMRATVALTGQGGWPMSVFLDHDRRAFYAGTYFPPHPHPGVPSFAMVLNALIDAWSTRRSTLTDIGASLIEHLQREAGAGPRTITASSANRAVIHLRQEFDAEHAGFGLAPKFPQPMVLEHLLRHNGRTGHVVALDMAASTLTAMAAGGICDQLAGGFHRYSVDAAWVVPHFEKMLYDNALLLRVYTHWWRATGSDLARRVMAETAEFLLRDLQTPEGAFAASLDADSEGGEGAYYVWTPEQVDALGGDCEALGVTAQGSFEGGTSVLQMVGDPGPSWPEVREHMRRARSARPGPARDDKVVVAWNAWAVAALAEAGVLTDRPDWVAAAERCAAFLMQVHWDGRTLQRVSRDGAVGQSPGVLEDYAALADALFVLAACTGRWQREALDLTGRMRDLFLAAGAVRETTAADLPALPVQKSDNATPSGWNTAAGVLLTLAAVNGDSQARGQCEQMVGQSLAEVGHPGMLGQAWSVAEALLDGPREVAVLDEVGGPLHRTALAATAPGAVVALGGPLLSGRDRLGGLPTAYVCRGWVCQRPTTDPGALADQLRQDIQERG